ncbi:MAG TPA: phosphotransferase family protein [Thermoleophilaceae bacterium]|nr:phosphotransferase family protein [Thermoleophilaceae bacterium]
MSSPDIVDTPAEAAELERPPLIVREPLEAFLDSHGLGSGPIEAEPVGDGHSNVTFVLERGGERYVLRRPPRPPLPPSAHDVLREARLLRALEPTPVRVPRVEAVCKDHGLLGVPFYVMEEVRGTVVTASMPPALDQPEARAGVGEDLIEALVEVHAVDWRAVGLEGFGKPSGYLERQLRRFNGLWEFNKTRELPRVQQLADWLAGNLPSSPETTIVHGDYRLGNVMLADDLPPRVVAIFDWELATLGDPLADMGYLTITWIEESDTPDTMFSALSAVTRQEGFPTRDELIALYEERSGRSVSDLRWYQTLALWKAAVFMEGNYKRSLAGSTDDPYLKLFGEGVPALAEAAWHVAHAPAPSS